MRIEDSPTGERRSQFLLLEKLLSSHEVLRMDHFSIMNPHRAVSARVKADRHSQGGMDHTVCEIGVGRGRVREWLRQTGKEAVGEHQQE